jgi:hypothetical protein
MFANPTQVGISQRVVATLVASAVVLWSLGAHFFTAQAADLADISNTISDSDPGVAPQHYIQFTVPTTSIAGANNIQVTFDSADDGAGGQDFAGGDISAVISDNSDLLVSVNEGAQAAPTFVASDNDSFTISGVTASPGDTVEIQVAAGVITNPSTVDSYEIQVGVANASTDSGKTRIAIVDNVLVTAIVDTVFDFTISAVATGTSINGTTTTDTSTPTLLDFGTLTANQIETLGQRLNVGTNARNGFVVTVESDSFLESANGAVIDPFIGTAEVTGPGTGWTDPANGIADDRTWGHWGFTTSDSDLGSLGGFYGGSDFGANEYAAVSSTTPREVFHHDGPSDGTTNNIGSTTVAYQIQITPLQEAADDYNTTLTYIATPTF